MAFDFSDVNGVISLITCGRISVAADNTVSLKESYCQMEINNKYISTEAFQNFSSVCLQESDKFSFKETEL